MEVNLRASQIRPKNLLKCKFFRVVYLTHSSFLLGCLPEARVGEASARLGSTAGLPIKSPKPQAENHIANFLTGAAGAPNPLVMRLSANSGGISGPMLDQPASPKGARP
jgi:hypothetical protein